MSGENDPILDGWTPAFLTDQQVAEIRVQLENITPSSCCDPNVAIELHQSAVELLNHIDATRRP